MKLLIYCRIYPAGHLLIIVFKLTKRSSSKGIIVIHKLSPGDDHDGTSVVVEAFIGMHGAGDHTGQGKVSTGVWDSRGVDAIGE